MFLCGVCGRSVNTNVIQNYGTESPIQYVSFGLSLVTLTKCVAERISYLRHNQETKPFSIMFLIDVLEALILFVLCLLGFEFLVLTNSMSIPRWMIMTIFSTTLYGPIFWLPTFLSKMLLHQLVSIFWMSIFALIYIFNFVSCNNCSQNQLNEQEFTFFNLE